MCIFSDCDKKKDNTIGGFLLCGIAGFVGFLIALLFIAIEAVKFLK
jgi:hypothetical protein